MLLETNPACEQANDTNLTQMKESPKAEVLQSQQDKHQWATHEDLHTITEMLRKMNTTLKNTHNIVTKVREHTLSQQLLTLDCLQKQIGNCWRQPAHATCGCRANKDSFYQNRQNVHIQRFNTQHTFNASLTSSQLIEDIHHHKATPDVMMGKNNNQAQNRRSNLNTTKHFHIRRSDRGDSDTTFDDNKTSDRKTFRPMGQTPRKTLFRARHRTEVQEEENEYDTIQLQVRRQLSEVVLRFCSNRNIFFLSHM